MLQNTNHKTLRVCWSLMSGLAALGFSSVAGAYPEYPYTVAAELDMDCTPECTLCHASTPGREDNADRDFLGSLLGDASKSVEDNVKSGDEGALEKALALLADKDTDGDGFTDVEELQAAPPSDPNVAELTPDSPGDGLCAAELRYGCGAQIADAHKPAPFHLWWAALAAASVMVWRRRQRSSD